MSHAYDEQPSLAIQIPSEVIALILDKLSIPVLYGDLFVFLNRRGLALAEKREIIQMALVCRYRARVCQWQLFNCITLRTRLDLFDFIALATWEESEIREYVKRIALAFTGPANGPWEHLVPLTLRKFSHISWRRV